MAPHSHRDDKLLAHLRRLLSELERIPAARREDELADVRADSVRAMLRRLERAPYRWTSDPDELATDAIMVGIGAPNSEMIAAGLSYSEPTAGIYWPDCVTSQAVISAGGDAGPYSVHQALEVAHRLANDWGLREVVILIDEPGLWRDEWGRLAEKEGLR